MRSAFAPAALVLAACLPFQLSAQSGDVFSADDLDAGLQRQVEQLGLGNTRGIWSFAEDDAEAEAEAEEQNPAVNASVDTGATAADPVVEQTVTAPVAAQPVAPVPDTKTPQTEQVTMRPTVATAPVQPNVVPELQQEYQINIAIQFDRNSANIRPTAEPQLQQICISLTRNTGFGLRLIGHTDASGSDEYNRVLSEQRAQSVRAYLISRCGVAANRLFASGLGETRLLDLYPPNDPRHRRVELQVAYVAQ